MEVRTHVVLSAGHVSEDVAIALDAISRGEDGFGDWRDHIICRANGEYGWWLLIKSLPRVASEELLPECLQCCLSLARAANAEWVLFDCEVEASPGLQFHEWLTPF